MIKTKTKLMQIMAKYLPSGIVKGRELALPPEKALQLAADLEAVGVVITGVDSWWFVEKHNGIAPALEVDLSIKDEVLKAEDAAHQSATLVRQFIKNDLSERTAFVSFTLDVPVDWNLFPALPHSAIV